MATVPQPQEELESTAPVITNGTENVSQPLSVPNGPESAAAPDQAQFLPDPTSTTLPVHDLATMGNGQNGNTQAISAGELTHN